MAIICWMIVFLLSTWLVVSLFICGYWFFEPADLFWDKHKYISAVIIIGAFLGCIVVIGLGVRPLLLFIPKNWTYETEEGEILVVSSIIAVCISLVATGFFVALFEKIGKIRRENKYFRTELRIRRKELDFFEESSVKKAAAEFRQRLEKLEELAVIDRLRPAQEVEQSVLLSLLKELEWRLESISELENGEDEQKQ